jgi:hypothetical protein
LLIKIAAVKVAIDAKNLNELGSVTSFVIFRWLLDSMQMKELDGLSKQAYDMVLASAAVGAGSKKSAGGGAIELMVAAHKSAKFAKASMKVAAKLVAGTPKVAKKGKLKKA